MKFNKLYLSLALVTAFIFACSPSKNLDRSQAPQAGPAPEINLGDYSTFSLDNGLRVIVVENHKLPRVSYQLTVDRDPVIEDDKAGYVSMAGQLLKSGTESKSKNEIDKAIDYIGANINTYSTGAYASALKKHSDDLLTIMSDVILNPTFPEDELEKVKKQTMSGLASAKTDANSISSNIVKAMRYGLNHPYGEQTTEETVEKISREDLVEYYNSYFKPNISYLVVVGDIDTEEARKQAEKHFGSWERGEVEKTMYPQPTPPETNRVIFVPVPNAVQSVVNITYPIDLKPGSPDAIAADVMNSILGGGVFSGRLMQNLREDKGFTYGARSSLSTDEHVGYFSAYASVRNEVTDSAVTEFLYELRNITDELVADSTLQFVKNGMNGSFARSLERPQTIARFALNIERYDLPENYYQNYLSNLAAVTKEDVKAMADKYIKPANAYITVVGNRDEVADKLAKFSGKNKVELRNRYGGEYVDMKPAPAGMTAQDVIDNYVEAIGGKAKWDAVKSLRQQGSMAMGPMSLTMVMKQNREGQFSMTVSQGEQVFVKQIYDGEKAMVSQMGQKQILEGDDAKEMAIQAEILPETSYGKYGYTLELKGIEDVDGQQAYVIEISTPAGSKSTEYYAVDSGLKIMSMSTQETPQGEITQTTVIKSYKEVDGLKFASEIDQQAGPQQVQMTIDEVTINPNLKNSDFSIE
jgi:predicted Zn-dependent peptidase/outer membrane lipoprotein-sorting protein